MKKLLIALAGFCTGTLCFAQMLPDSTVQVCAYWDKGDVMVYDYTETRTSTVNGVTVGTTSASEKHVFEITDATEDSYIVKLSFEDLVNTPLQTGAFNELAERISENFWFETKTNELGTVQDIANEEKALEACKAMIPVMTDRVLSKYTAQELKEEGTSREKLIQQFMAGVCTEEFMESLCVKYVIPILLYHGARFNLDQEYTVSQTLMGILGDNNLDVDWKFWAESEECSEDFVLIHSYTEADKEALTPILKELILDSLQEGLTPDEIAELMSDPDELNEGLEELIQSMDASVEQYSVIAIHLGSGYPYRWWLKRVTTLEEDDSTTVITEEKELTFSEDDYRNQ